MTRQEMAAIMMAEGPWERRRKDDDEWYSDLSPFWDWRCYEYRVKPQPKVLWVNECMGCLSGSYAFAHASKDAALRYADSTAIRTAVRYVESPEE